MMGTVWHWEWDVNPQWRWWAPWRPKFVRMQREYLVERHAGVLSLVRYFPPLHHNCRCVVKEAE